MASHASLVLGCGGPRTDRHRALPPVLPGDRGIRVRARSPSRRRASRSPRRRSRPRPCPRSRRRPPTGEQPGTGGGQLPRTGWDALLYFGLGMALLLAGARLRVLTRISEVVQRVRRRRPRPRCARPLSPYERPACAHRAGPRPGPAPRGAEHADRPAPDGRRRGTSRALARFWQAISPNPSYCGPRPAGIACFAHGRAVHAVQHERQRKEAWTPAPASPLRRKPTTEPYASSSRTVTRWRGRHCVMR